MLEQSNEVTHDEGLTPAHVGGVLVQTFGRGGNTGDYLGNENGDNNSDMLWAHARSGL